MRKSLKPLDPMHHNSLPPVEYVSNSYFVSFLECFLKSAALAATPAYMSLSAFIIVLELSGDDTVTSKAAELPLPQLVTKMSSDPSHYQILVNYFVYISISAHFF